MKFELEILHLLIDSLSLTFFLRRNLPCIRLSIYICAKYEL